MYQLATNQELRYSKLTVGLFIVCLILTVPVFYPNASILASSSRLLGLWGGLLLFVTLQQFQFSNKHKQRLLWFIVIAVTIEALFGYFQYFVLEEGNLFGYNTERNRPYGIFQQPNVMASFLATGFVLSGYLLARQPIKYQAKISDVTLLYIIPALTIPLLIVLASRTGWLAGILCLFLITPYLYRFATKKRFWGWLASVALGIILGFVFSSSGSGELVKEKAKLEDVRSYIYPQAIDMVVEKPFTGYGYGRFESEYILYTARQHHLNSDYKPGLATMDHPHNEMLFWAVEGGLLPVLGILLAAGMVLQRIYHGKKGTRLAIFSLFIPIVLHSQLEYPFYHSAIHWIIFVILLYWVDQRVNVPRFAPFTVFGKTVLRVSSLLLPILTSFYMLSALHTNYILTQFEKSQPKDPEILNRVTNPVVWKDRFDWDVYSTYLNIGLHQQNPEFIQPYIDWSLEIIKDKPRPAFYNNLILAFQGLGDESRAEQVRAEAQYLFPNRDFSTVQLRLPRSSSDTQSSAEITVQEITE